MIVQGVLGREGGSGFVWILGFISFFRAPEKPASVRYSYAPTPWAISSRKVAGEQVPLAVPTV